MAKQVINVGSQPNDGNGDSVRLAGGKINSNFTELYDSVSILEANVASIDSQVTILSSNVSSLSTLPDTVNALSQTVTNISNSYVSNADLQSALTALTDSDNQELSFDSDTNELSISDGNTIDLSGLSVDLTGYATESFVNTAISDAISGQSAGISNVVEDTTPQLGGALDTNGKNIVAPTAELFRIFVQGGSGDIQVSAPTSASLTSENQVNVSGDSLILASGSGQLNVVANTALGGILTLNDVIFPGEKGEAGQVLAITNSTTGQLSWVSPSIGGGGASAIDDLTDVDTSTVPPTNGQLLAWNSANSVWVPVNANSASVDLSTSSISALLDVDFNGVTLSNSAGAGKVLAWNQTSEAFVPVDKGIESLSADLEPQLGGNLDTNGNNITGTGGIGLGDATTGLTFTTASGLMQIRHGTEGGIELTDPNLGTNSIISTTAGLTLEAANGPMDFNVTPGQGFQFNDLVRVIGSMEIVGSPGTLTVEANMTANNISTGVLTADSVVTQGTGDSNITAGANLVLDAGNAVVIQNSPIRLSSYTITGRNAIAAQNGDIVYNSETRQVEAYEDSQWNKMGTGTHYFNVVNNNTSAYSFTDDYNHWFPTSEDNPVLYLRRGETYRFDVNAPTHPFEIRVSNGGAAYTAGVTNNADDVGIVEFKVPMSAPATLYYQCTVHSAMGNVINIV